jgi:TonB family protein
VAHAASDLSFRFDRMSPPALALALLVHAVMALALWWLGHQATRPEQPERAIEVTIERPPPAPKPEPPKPEPPKPEPPKVQPEPVQGLAPPAEITADRRTQVPGSKEQPRNTEPAEQLGPQTALAAPQPKAQPTPPAPQPPQEAKPQPQPQPQHPRPPEQKPAPQAHAPAPHPPAPRPPAHSPLVARPQAPPPVANPGQGTSSPFVNPADTYNRALASDNYLWQVVRKLSGYRYQAHVNVTQGLTVVRITIARDGRLLDVRVVRSSGFRELDEGVVNGIRRGSPYAPLPPNIQGASASFDLPLVSVYR